MDDDLQDTAFPELDPEFEEDTELRSEEEQLYEEVREFFVSFLKGVRAAQLYVEGNPILHQFIAELRQRLSDIWDRMPSLDVTIHETEIHWRERPVYRSEGLQDNLAFQLYKDGIRRLSFNPGCEDDELREFMDVLRLGRQLKDDEDDLLTLMWHRDFQHIRYEYVDVLGGEVQLPDVDPNRDAGTELPDIAELELTPEMETPVLREDFEPSLYFLEEAEISTLQRELRTEWERELKQDVVTALLDQYEIGEAERREEVTEIMREMLPRVLAEGDFAHAAFILQELNVIAERRGDPAIAREVEEMAADLSQPEVLEQLLRILEDGSVEPTSEALATLLNALRSEAIVVLIRAMPSIVRQEARKQLLETLERLAALNPGLMQELVESEDPRVAAEAARIAGRLQMTDLAEPLTKLLDREEEDVRVAAVEGLTALRSSMAGRPLIDALEDESREVRVAAAKGLASLRYRPAADDLERHIQRRSLLKSDLTEQLSFFEAYARAVSAEGVPLLNRILNGRRFLWFRYPPQLRACAARALSLIGGAEAAEALGKGERDKDPMVRSAVHAARRKEPEDDERRPHEEATDAGG